MKRRGLTLFRTASYRPSVAEVARQGAAIFSADEELRIGAGAEPQHLVAAWLWK